MRRKGRDAGWKMSFESRGGINLSPSRVLTGNLWEETCLVTVLCVLARGDNYSGRGSADSLDSFPLKTIRNLSLPHVSAVSMFIRLKSRLVGNLHTSLRFTVPPPLR